MKNKVIVAKIVDQRIDKEITRPKLRKNLIRLSLAKKVEKAMIKKDLSLKNLLDDVKIERNRYTTNS